MVLGDKFWYLKGYQEIIEELGSSNFGLSSEKAKQRLIQYGLNKLREAKVDSLLILFLKQFKSPLIYILLIASLIVFITGEYTDGFVILVVLLINAIIGAVQEGRAKQTLFALKKFSGINVLVLRDSKESIIPDTDLVPGDIIILQEGTQIPADARVIESFNLAVDQAALTGESEPVYKVDQILQEKKIIPADQKNMLFKGTHILAGNGKAIVVSTGLDTEIGKIAEQIQKIDTEIPLQKNIRYISKVIIILIGSISIFLFIIGILLGYSTTDMFKTVVSLAVSIIPEGLPIVITLILAHGVLRMSRRNVLVKRLQAVESLGQASVIAVDKTGTITRNEMIIQQVCVNGKIFDIKGIGYSPEGEILFNKQIVDLLKYPELIFMGKLSILCANARVFYSKEKKDWQISGEPTEAALLVFGQKVGFNKDDIEKEFLENISIPFDYHDKYHATIHKTNNKALLNIIGAPETVLPLCKKIRINNKDEDFLDEHVEKIRKIINEMSARGLRILAVGVNESVSDEIKDSELKSLTFIGLLGMEDSLRPEVHGAMQKAKMAGAKVIMITGDHKITARAIAQQAGIYQEGDEVLTGEEMDNLDNYELDEILDRVSVYARATPEHKLRIIEAYKARGQIIAMTGDGVNDAPSLVSADLGVAMGKIGTEVAKESSDLILLDDNFGNIIEAIKEGRRIYQSIKKVMLYLFSTGLAEVAVIIGAILLKLPLPLLAAQLLWLNLVSDGFPILAMSMDIGEEGILNKKPNKKRVIVDFLMKKRMILMALPMAIGTLLVFYFYLPADVFIKGETANMLKAWTMALTTLAAFQWFNAWNCISDVKSVFREKFSNNKFLILATLLVIALQFVAVYVPFFQRILHTIELSLTEWLIALSVAFSVVLFEEVHKLISRYALFRYY